MEVQTSMENIYTAKTWFQLKCEDPHIRHLWIKARILCTIKRGPITLLHMFEYDTSQLGRETPLTSSEPVLWSSQAHYGIRVLFDRIVTRWEPANLFSSFRRDFTLHNSLTPERLFPVPQKFGNISLKNAKV
jgi:hypothetical protein